MRAGRWNAVRPAVITTAALLALVVAASALSLAGPPVPMARAAVAPVCSALEPNTSLNATVAHHYPNASLLPNEASAQSGLVSTWSAVCGSASFSSGYEASASPQVSYVLRVMDQNRTAAGGLIGSLFAEFTLAWSAACPTGAGPYPVGYDCVYADVWNANLTTTSVVGPNASITSARFVQCDTPAQNESDVGTVAGFYGSGPLQPNESVAESEVTAIWGSICTSVPYLDAIVGHANATASWGASVGFSANLSGSGNQTPGANRTGGDLVFEWDVSWNAACPANSSAAQQYPSCEYTDAWTANLATDTYRGPSLEVFTPLGGAPVAVAPTHASSATPWWAVPGDDLVLAAVMAVLGAAAWLIVRRRRGGPGPAAPAPSRPSGP